MPVTYNLIASNILSSSAASVTFSSIPSTYTDLVVKLSVRNTTTGNTVSDFFFNVNGSSGTIYSRTRLQGNGATVVSDRTTSNALNVAENLLTGGSATASTFSNVDIYFPNYKVSQNKPHSVFGTMETNATTAYIVAQANLISDTSAISSITFTSGSGNFASGSSFFLYGIKNS